MHPPLSKFLTIVYLNIVFKLELPYQENPAFLMRVALKCIPFFEIPFVYTMICSVRHFKTQFSFRCLGLFFFKKIVCIPH